MSANEFARASGQKAGLKLGYNYLLDDVPGLERKSLWGRTRDDDGPVGGKPEGKGGGAGDKGGGPGGKGGGDVNNAPTDISLSSTTVDENSGGGVLVGNLTATDADKREKFTFSLLDDAEGRFYIDGAKLKVSAGADLDFETQPSHTIRILVRDSGGASYTEYFTISLVDVAEGQDPQTPPEEPVDPSPPDPVPYYVEALTGADSQRWNYPDAAGTATQVSYTFLDAVPDYYGSGATERNNFTSFNQTQIAATRDILQDVSDFANVTFVESADPTSDLTFGNANLGSAYGAWAYLASPYGQTPGDVWINNYYASQLSPIPGNYAYKTHVHEIGHALGLTHPGDYDVGQDGASYLPVGEDSRQFTTMSYNAHPDMGSTETQSMLIYDIAALQHLYGANYGHNAGNDVYNYAGANKLIEAIWDGGGFDTLSVAGSSVSAILNLEEGGFSSIGMNGAKQAVSNISIAFGAEIEAAVGGDGDDVLIGNAGDNVLTGGLGSDIFVFGLDWGADKVADFQNGIDLLDFSGLGLGLGDFAIAAQAGGAAISVGDDSVFLAGLSSGQIDQSDFIFT